MLYCKINQGQNVYKNGSIGHCFFVVQKGLLDMLTNQKIIKQLKPQDGFGQLALLYNTERTSTVTARQSCSMWFIDRQSFREAVEEVIIRDYNDNRRCIDKTKFFCNLNNDQKDIIASAFVTQKYNKDEIIVQEGDPGSSFYYIKQGTVSVYKNNKFLRKLVVGDSFGQQSLYYNTIRQLTIKVDDQVTCLILGRDTLITILGDKFYQITYKNYIKNALQKNYLLNKLNKIQLNKVIDSMKILTYKTNQIVFKKGISGFQKIVVIMQGTLKKLKNGTIIANCGQCWGQQYLTQNNKYKILQDQIIMQNYGIVAQISDTIFYQSIGGLSFQQVIKKSQNNNKQQKFIIYLNATKNNLQSVKLDHFIYVKKINQTQFGSIHLIKSLQNGYYVLKSFQKSQIMEYEVQKFISEQKKIMFSLSFPFIIQLGKYFQTQQNIYYITEFINGQNFCDVMQKIGLLSTQDSQFYAASIILILQYFHNNFIVCRDIKPQNFMVDQQGYLKLINLPLSKTIKNENNQMGKTFTIIGTPHYMAPDIILGKGYNNLIDLWSLGVCLYEFLCGVLPFGDVSSTPYQIYQEIMENQWNFPQFMNDKKAKQLISQLLSHKPEQRHGGSFTNLKLHPWFQDFNWSQLLNKQTNLITPPHIPQTKLLINKQKQNPIKQKMIDKLKQIQRQERDNSIDGLPCDSGEWEAFEPIIGGNEQIDNEESQSVIQQF